MEHLPLPDVCAPGAKVRVPYLGIVRYDNNGFYDYPQRCGIREADLIDFGSQDDRSDLRLSCLQEWLFFGSLHDFSVMSGVALDLDAFIETEERTQWITTRPLIDFAARLVYANARSYPPANWSSIKPSESWSAILEHRPILVVACLTQRLGIPEAVQSERRRKVGELLRKVKSLPIWQDSPNQPCTTTQRHVLWSIGILLESIHYISQGCYGAQPETPPHLDLDYAFHEMKSRGWCPSRLSQKMSYTPASTRYMLSLLPSFDQRRHESCTEIRCFETPLAMTRSNIGHDEHSSQGSCLMTCVDESKVVEILIQGDYPLIKTSVDEAGNFDLSATPASTASGYIAISHVWAHGLGNPHRNGIPACQVRKLKGLVEMVGIRDRLLWLDTLCVPVSDRFRKYRKLALFKMRQSYLNASKVLVLDSSLQEVGGSIYERRLQVACSEWMQRLWTLQEAILPKAEDLLFQFKTGTATLSDLVTDSTLVKPSKPLTNDDFIGGWSEVWHSLELQTTDLLRTQFPKFSTDENNLLVLVRTLHRRNTTKIEDEPICLATLTDTPLEQFNGRPDLAQVLKAIDNLPESLVLIPGPRMVNTGFRWAPRSFLLQRDSQIGNTRAAIEENNNKGKLTDRGMMIFKPSIALEQGFKIDKDFVEFTPLGIKTQHCLHKIRASTSLEDGSLQLLPRSLGTAAIIFERREMITDVMRAVLVSNVRQEGDVKYCHYELALAVSLLPNPVKDVPTYIRGTYHTPEYWCID